MLYFFYENQILYPPPLPTKLLGNVFILLTLSFTILIFASCILEADESQKGTETGTAPAPLPPDFSDHEPEPEDEAEEEVPEVSETLSFTIQPPVMCVPADTSYTLTCLAQKTDGIPAYRWFELTKAQADALKYSSQDIENMSLTPVSETWSASPDYEVPPFREKGIRWFICAATCTPQQPETAVYSKVAAVAYTGLPVLYLDTGDVQTSEITKNEYVETDFSLVAAGLGEGYADVQGRVKLKGRGNSSWNLPKKGYNIKFSEKQSLFGLPAAKKWCIVANYSDKTLLRNRFASVLGNQVLLRTDADGNLTSWNPHFVSVDVVMNGKYMGNYTFCEKITITQGRIGIQDISGCKEKKITGGEYTDQNGDGNADLYDGGFILEVDGRHDADFWFDTTQGVPVTLKDPDTVSAETQEHIKKVVQAAEDTLYGTPGDDDNTEPESWQDYLDMNSFVDWYLVNELTKNNDAIFATSVYMFYNPADGKLHLGPNWDFDISCGNIYYNGCDNAEGFWIKNAKWISRLFEDDDFKQAVQERWNSKKDALCEAISTSIQLIADEIQVSAELNFYRWQILGKYVWPNAAGYEARTTYQSELDYMKEWLFARYDWLDSALNEL